MINFQEFFKGKKVTIMGPGLLGRGVGDIAFLAEMGAEVLATDLKTKEELKPSLEKLKKYKNIKYVLGQHRLEDFSNCDLVFKASGAPLDSIYIAEAKKNKIPIYTSAAFFAKFSGLPAIGVTGTRGKSTVTHLLIHILESVGKKIIKGGNIVGVSNLQLLKKLKDSRGPSVPSEMSVMSGNFRNRASDLSTFGAIAILELDSWQLQGFAEQKISPNISIWTTFYQDHMNYYKNDMKKYFDDKASIFKYQKFSKVKPFLQKDFFAQGLTLENKNSLPSLVIGRQVLPFLKKWGGKNFQKYLTPRSDLGDFKDPTLVSFNIAPKKLPSGWKFNLPGLHNQYNARIVVEAARLLGIKDVQIKKALLTFPGLSGRLQFLGESKTGVRIYNDSISTTPEATIAALHALGDKKKRKVILIFGGSSKNLDIKKLLQEIPKWCSKVIMFKGSGTDLIREKVFALQKKGVRVYEEEALNKTIQRALAIAQSGEILLYSPAFSSFGKYFKNEFDREAQFLKEISSQFKIVL
jgi:UDP-N-acetylmuramoylalanine--D-glutamate ligase